MRRICKIFWPNTISNEELYRLTGSGPIANEIKRRKWNWIGHTLRKGERDIARMAFEWNPQGTRRRGRPAITWIRSIQSESRSMGTWSQIKHIAQDRARWREFVAALCSNRNDN